MNNNTPALSSIPVPGWITEKQLAEHLQVSTRHLINLRKCGLPFVQLGDSVRYDLEEVAGCAEGEPREMAERELRATQATGLLTLVPIHRREPNSIAKVRLSPANEQAFFDYIGLPSPTARRAEWAALFREAASWLVPERFAHSGANFCASRARTASCHST